MLEYCKTILQKVSFDPHLFEKELKKSIGYLLPEETEQFIKWAEMTFGNQYAEIISNIQNLF